MGSGLSLNYEQIALLIKRDLQIKFENEQRMLPQCYQEYIIYRDYLEEQKLLSQLKAIDDHVKKVNTYLSVTAK
jgi:hypothetical protein